MQSKVFVIGSVAMALVLALSNYLVLFPLGEWLTWAAFSFPLAFLVTDCVNRIANAAIARKVVYVGFIIGAPLSFFSAQAADGATWQNAARIAIASGTAFACAQLLDIAIFNRLRKAVWWLPPLASSAPTAVVDTFLFFGIAFVGLGLPWQQWAVGDLFVKAIMIAILLPPYRLLTFRFAGAPS